MSIGRPVLSVPPPPPLTHPITHSQGRQVKATARDTPTSAVYVLTGMLDSITTENGVRLLYPKFIVSQGGG